MSSESLVFSHQRETVLALSKYFTHLDVYSAESSQETVPANVRVFSLPWKIKSPIRNSITILKTLFPILIKNRNCVVFTHMVDVHAAIVSPLTWILRIPHFFWYAHANNSRYLFWSSFFVSKIVSSTKGSCNLKVNKRKIVYINQGIDPKLFPFSLPTKSLSRKLLYYGRLDQSKNIHLFPKLMKMLETKTTSYGIDTYGDSTTLESKNYISNIKLDLKVIPSRSHITFNGPINRATISQVASNYGTFLNLFSGSLDKTLIEATFLGLPVVTWNREYCFQFGTWSKDPVFESLEFIQRELEFISAMPLADLKMELLQRLRFAQNHHSFSGWIDRLVSVIRRDETQ